MRHEYIRNVVELNPHPNSIAYFIRSALATVPRLSFRRLGDLQIGTLSIHGIDGSYWLHKQLDLLDITDLVFRKEIYQRQFDGFRSMRLLTIGEDVNDLELLEIYQPDIILHQTACQLPMKLKSDDRVIDNKVYSISTISDSAIDVFDQALVAFDSVIQGYLSQSTLLLDASELLVWDGFHHIERDGKATWIWTGRGRTARLIVPILAPRQRITLYLYGNEIPLNPNSVALTVDGWITPIIFKSGELNFEVEQSTKKSAHHSLVCLKHAHVVSANDGSRELGIAINKMLIEAI